MRIASPLSSLVNYQVGDDTRRGEDGGGLVVDQGYGFGVDQLTTAVESLSV